jgi:hypothetical protein
VCCVDSLRLSAPSLLCTCLVHTQPLTFGQDADHIEQAESGQLKGALVPAGGACR